MMLRNVTYFSGVIAGIFRSSDTDELADLETG